MCLSEDGESSVSVVSSVSKAGLRRKWLEVSHGGTAHGLRCQAWGFGPFRPLAVGSGDIVKGLKSNMVRTRNIWGSWVRSEAPEDIQNRRDRSWSLTRDKGLHSYDKPT